MLLKLLKLGNKRIENRVIDDNVGNYDTGRAVLHTAIKRNNKDEQNDPHLTSMLGVLKYESIYID